MNEIKVKDVMTHLVVSVRPQDRIREVAKRLLSNRISGAPVVVGGRLAGIVSEADLVSGNPLTTVDEVMTREVVTTSPETSVLDAASLIDRHRLRRLPVVDSEGYVVGVLARADLVRAMVRSNEACTLREVS